MLFLSWHAEVPTKKGARPKKSPAFFWGGFSINGLPPDLALHVASNQPLLPSISVFRRKHNVSYTLTAGGNSHIICTHSLQLHLFGNPLKMFYIMFWCIFFVGPPSGQDVLVSGC